MVRLLGQRSVTEYGVALRRLFYSENGTRHATVNHAVFRMPANTANCHNHTRGPCSQDYNEVVGAQLIEPQMYPCIFIGY